MTRFIFFLVGRFTGFINLIESRLLTFFDWADNKNFFAWTLIFWCFLVLFIFYPYSLSLETSVILKQSAFILGGLISFVILIISVLYRRIKLSNTFFFLALLAIAITSVISLIFTNRPMISFTGLFFEQDTLATIISLVIIIIASAFSFKNWSGDLGLLITKVVGFSIILPTVILELFSTESIWRYLYIDKTSLQVMAVMVVLVGAYRLDFYRSSNWFEKSSLFLLIVSSLAICYKAPHFVLILTGFIFCLYLSIQGLRLAKFLPFSSIIVSLVFGLFLFTSFNETNKENNSLYIREVTFLQEALASAFQWGETNLLLGMGPHTFNYFWDIYRPYASYYDELWPADYEPPYVYNQPRYAFGLIPTIIINSGFLGLFSWLAFFLTIGYLALNKLNHTFLSYDQRTLLALLSLYGLIALFLETSQVYVMAITALALGSLVANDIQMKARFNQNNIYRSFRLFILLVLVVVMCFVLVSTQKIVSTSLIFQKTVDYWLSVSDSVGLPIKSVEKIINDRPQPEYYRVLAQIQLYSAKNYLLQNPTLSEQDVETVRKFLGESLINATKAAELNGDDFRSWLLLGDINTFIFIFGAKDAEVMASNHYNQAISLLNVQPLAHYGLARVSHLGGDQEKSLQSVEEALKFRPGWADAEKLKAEIIATQNLPTN